MKPNYDKIKKLLDVFIKSERTFITINDLIAESDTGIADEDFLFHFLLIVENGLVSDKNLMCSSPEDVGLVFGLNGHVITIQVPIRLTQSGLDFANALAQKPVLERVKQELADAPFEFVKMAASKFFSKILSERIGI